MKRRDGGKDIYINIQRNRCGSETRRREANVSAVIRMWKRNSRS